MSESSSSSLATQAIPKLLIQQALPASVGILVMSLNILIDTLFVGQWIGAYAIAAINIVLPVSFFIAALGMSIGIGGSSIISRALGDKNKALATKTLLEMGYKNVAHVDGGFGAMCQTGFSIQKDN